MPVHLENTLSPRSLPDEPCSTSSNSQLQLSGQIGTVEQEGDKLQEARIQLLGSRFRLKDQRGELRDLRQGTGLAEGAVINQLRIIFQERNIVFPVELEIALAHALTMRDSLGLLEGTYEDEEEKYDGLEWDYTQKEEKYVTRLTSHNDNAMDASNNTRSDDTALYAPIPRDSDILPTGFPDLRPDVFMKPLRLSETALQSFEQDQSSNIPQVPRSTFCLYQPSGRNYMYSSLPRASSESSMSPAHIDWNRIKTRVDNWILDSVSCSQYQRLVLRSMFQKNDLDDAIWWDLVMQHWDSDGSNTPPTGMNADDSSYVLRDPPGPPATATTIVASRSRVETQCHEVEQVSQEHFMCHDEQDIHAQLIGRSSPEASSNQLGHELQTCNMEVIGLQVVVPSKPQESAEMVHRNRDNLEIVTSLKHPPSKRKTTIPKLGTLQSTVQKRFDGPSQPSHSTPLENCTQKNTTNNISQHHHRHWSNPELQRHPNKAMHPKHHENPTSEFRPYSPDFDLIDNAIRQGTFLGPYGYRRPVSPPETRSQSCSRSPSVQSRQLQALEHIDHDASLQPSFSAAKRAFPETAYAFQSAFATTYERQGQSLAIMCPTAGFTNFRSLGVLTPIL